MKTKRNPVAKALRTPTFRMRVVRNAKAYDRKKADRKHMDVF